MSIQFLDKRERDAQARVEAWRGVLEKTNRILSGQRVTVSVVPDSEIAGAMREVPGWSDGKDIYLNDQMVRKMMSTKDHVAAVLRLKGLNYHELCHVLYTPRMSDELPRAIQEQIHTTGDTTWWYAFNALEDQRIETWFTSSYGASKRYFEATILEWVLRDGNAESAILIYGRKYLSPRIRVQAGSVFKKKYGEPLYVAFQAVIDEYVTLTLPQQTNKARRLVAEYHELLGKMRQAQGAPLPTMPVMDNGMSGSTDGVPNQNFPDSPRAGRVMAKDAKRARDKAAEVVEDTIDADLEAEAEMDADAKAKASTPEGSETASSDKSGAGVSTSGTGAGESLAEAIESFMDAAEEGMSEVREDEFVQRDAASIMDAVKASEQNGEAVAMGKEVAKSAHTPAPEATKQAVRKIVSTILRIRQEAEPETLRKQSSGRVDVRRVLSRQPHETDIFSTWDVGTEDETGMEAVLLVDISGSMARKMPEATEAMWAFKRSFDKLDIRTTVILYNSGHSILWQPHEKAPSGIPTVSARGGTNPTTALRQAYLILTRSHAPNKVLITVTDGHWGGDAREHEALVGAMHKAGITSMLLGLERAVANYGQHNHMEGHDLESARDLPKAALKLVSRILRDAVRA